MIPKPMMAALADARLTDAAVRVLLSLWSHAKRSQLTVWPKRERIAAQTGLDKWQVSKATRLLEEAGYIAKEGAGGYSKATRYTLQNGVPTNTVDEQQRCLHEHRNSPNYGVTSDTGPGVTSDTRKEVSIGSSSKEGNAKIGRSTARADAARAARGQKDANGTGGEVDERCQGPAERGRGVSASDPRGGGGQGQDRARRRGESAVAYVTRIQRLEAVEQAGDGNIVDLAARNWRRE